MEFLFDHVRTNFQIVASSQRLRISDKLRGTDVSVTWDKFRSENSRDSSWQSMTDGNLTWEYQLKSRRILRRNTSIYPKLIQRISNRPFAPSVAIKNWRNDNKNFLLSSYLVMPSSTKASASMTAFESSPPPLPRWDAIVVTARDAPSADALQKELKRRQESGWPLSLKVNLWRKEQKWKCICRLCIIFHLLFLRPIFGISRIVFCWLSRTPSRL